MSHQTVKQLTDTAIDWVSRMRTDASNELNGAAAREFSLAITALEDAQMRATRGLAMLQGKFAPADLEVDDA